MLWSKQYYNFDVPRWLAGDPGQPAPPEGRNRGRNHGWTHLNNADIMSMPDTWEYPWYAAWDLSFHCLALAQVDADFAKDQLLLLTREWYMHLGQAAWRHAAQVIEAKSLQLLLGGRPGGERIRIDPDSTIAGHHGRTGWPAGEAVLLLHHRGVGGSLHTRPAGNVACTTHCWATANRRTEVLLLPVPPHLLFPARPKGDLAAALPEVGGVVVADVGTTLERPDDAVHPTLDPFGPGLDVGGLHLPGLVELHHLAVERPGDGVAAPVEELVGPAEEGDRSARLVEHLCRLLERVQVVLVVRGVELHPHDELSSPALADAVDIETLVAAQRVRAPHREG